MRTETCANCRFRGDDEAQKGADFWASCRINPPAQSSNCVVPAADLWAGQWPATRRTDWCGSFQKGSNQAVAVVIGKPELV